MTDGRSVEAEADTERTAVKTYVPAYQKERWRAHADELDASLSEFVRTMVQAGRRGFGAAVAGEAESLAGGEAEAPASGEGSPAGDEAELTEDVRPATAADPRPATDGRPAAAADGGVDVEERVVDALDADGALSWPDLLAAAVPEDFEEAVDETVGRLQEDNRVAYRPKDDVFVLADDERRR